jgi:Aerotolerance regulator N-terminal/von Willebrand factor type A domain
VSFIHLALVAGTALGLVPILIHLLTRRRHKVVRWGAMKYLLEAIEEQNKRIQIEDLILLALRVLVVVLIALALARPLIRSEAVGSGPRLAVVLIDNSPSMRARRGGSSHWEIARAWTRDLLERLPKGSAVAVIPMAGAGGGSEGLLQPSRQLAVAREVLSKLAISARRSDPATVIAKAHAIVSGGGAGGSSRGLPATRTVYVISDFQAVDWSADRPALKKALVELLADKAGPALVAVQCSSGETRNTCVTDLSRAGRIIKVDSPARISATLVRRSARGEGGGAAVQDLASTLEVDGVRVDSRAAKLRPDQSKDAIFYASFAKEGDHAVVLRSAADTSPADDVRYLAVEAREEVRVLLVDGDPHPREEFLSESFYLRFALKPGARALSPIETRVVDVDSFGSEDLKSFDMVVLANVDSLSVTRVRDLAAYVRSGRALLIFLGDQVDAANYNSGLFGGADALTRIRLGNVARAPKDDGFKIAVGKLVGPVMSFFKDGGGGVAKARFSHAFDLNLDTAPEAKVHARLTPGNRPLVVAADVGEGRLALMNCSADVGWSGLPLKPAFTAIIQRMVVWLLEPRSRCQNLLPGQKYRLVLPLAAVGKTVSFKTPGSRSYARKPEARGTKQRMALVEFSKTEEPGFYEVSWEGVGGETQRRLFSVNIDPEESDLAAIQGPALRELAGGGRSQWVDATAVASEKVQSGGREFWRAIFLVALAVLGLETYLSRRFSGGGG